MNENEEKKGPLRNFTFLEAADKRLLELKKETGKTMTAIIEDLILGRRQFSAEIERFIAEQMARHHRPRNEIVESALYVAMKFAASQIPNPKEFKPTITKSEEEIMALGTSQVSDAIRLSQESEKKQTTGSPSENKASQAANARARLKK